MLRIRFLILVFICQFSGMVWAGQFISAEDKGFVYSGRIDFSDKSAPVFSWPGTSVQFNFQGTNLAVKLKDEQGKNYYDVIIDGKANFPYVIEAKQGQQQYQITSNLANTKHHVLIYKRTEGAEGATQFLGVDIGDQDKMLASPVLPQRKIEIFGDSITSGMGNLAPINAKDNVASQKDNYWAYGSIAARQLNAQLHTISKSGIGIMVSWFDFTMPDYFDQLSAVGNNNSVWDFNQWTPDVVVVNLFQNDSWLVIKKEYMSQQPDPAQIIQAYEAFISSIRNKYKNAHIVCALGSMDAIKSDSAWPGYIKSAVKSLKRQGDNNISTLFFDDQGYYAHPRVMHQQNNADKLVAHLKQQMSW
ncbi:GDSL-type esterase/lipase family protein [Neptunicella marina]|uniref:Electron transporter RnfD n=1 Tax=Neptunicella marina TaxID=2125989 RepID=A0A8J6IXS2_9ALTE|nr:GDSL-type esterase/lipase family protein [Neptunicella marina]MBC3767321.1 electron transporter RnfD [Neptunicella marina]